MLTRYNQRNLTWVDMVAPVPSEVKALMHEFSLDPLIAEELLSPSFKSKVERRGDSIYVILHFPALRLSGARAEQEIDFIIGKNFLITTRYENIDPLHSFAKAFEVQAVLGRNAHTHGGHLFAALAHDIYRAIGSECELLENRLQEIEDRIFRGKERQMVIELSHAGRIIHDFRQALLPHKEMLTSLEPVASRFFGQEVAYYIRDLGGVEERVERTLENLRESVQELRATNDSLLNTKQNEIMKTLTVLAFVFLPLSFVAGLFGMNTVNNPIIGNAYDFWIIFGLMFIIAVGCFIYFKRKNWL